MPSRIDRILVPSSVVLVAMGMTLWLATGGTRTPTAWFLSDADAPKAKTLVDFLVGAGIVTVGIGYLCNAVFAFRMMSSEKCRFVDFSRLMDAFGLKLSQPAEIRANAQEVRLCKWYRQWANKRRVRQNLQKAILAEFHLRLHSHASQSLIDYCSRRNTAWYTAKTSTIGSIFGWLVACAMLYSSPTFSHASCPQLVGLAVSFMVFVLVLPIALSRQGKMWNEEFWGVCWKWVLWDLQCHPAPRSWLNSLPRGVEWVC